MTNKEYILDCLVDGDNYGECETQIKEYFKFVRVDIGIEEISKLINEMLDEGLICVNETWTNEHGEKPYVITDTGRAFLSKIIDPT